MAEYIDIDAPIDVAVYQSNKRLQITIRQILESNDAKYECSDVVERKRGKWIEGNGVDYVRCSCCHKNYDWVSQAQYYNFCPNCGADMRGQKDD